MRKQSGKTFLVFFVICVDWTGPKIGGILMVEMRKARKGFSAGAATFVTKQYI